jgi:hypothetical protein
MEHLIKLLTPMTELDSILKDYPNRFPKIGSSLSSFCDKSGAGTLGGFVSIDGPHTGRYAITNDHVVFPPDSPNPAGHGNVFKLDGKLSRRERLKIQQPAKGDLKSLVSHLKRDRKRFYTQIQDLRKKKARAEKGIDLFNNIAQQNLVCFETGLQEITQRLKTTQRHKPHLGIVALSSGQRKDCHGFRMDWSLISLCPERFVKNKNHAVNEVSSL